VTRVLLSLALVLVQTLPSKPPSGALSEGEFEQLMSRLARAWSTQDTDLGVSCFTEDAVYMQPPDQQLYRTTRELRKFFGALKPGTSMKFHHLAFNAALQVGFGEFSFGEERSAKADHGIVVVELRGGRIAFWREYFQEGPADFARFIAQDGKTWKWTIQDYP